MKPNFIFKNWGGGRNNSSHLIALLTLVLTAFGAYTTHALTPITIEVDNDSPIEGCDQLTFTVTVCNDNAQYRDAAVRVYQMGYFEITDIGDFGYYQPGSTKENSYVHKFISQMAPNDCQELTFTAMAMSQIENIPNEVEAKVQFVYNGQNDNQEDAVQVTSQGYIVLDGRTTALTYSTAYSNGILPLGGATCDQPGYIPVPISKITVLGTFIVNTYEFCLGTPTFASVIMGEDAEIIVEDGATLTINGSIESCQGMWRQILVNSGGRLFMNNHSLIRGLIKDAARAISLQGGAEVYLQRIDFEDNHVGVFITNLETGGTAYTDPILTRFNDLKFENNLEGTLKGTIDESLLAESNADPDYSYCGVYVWGGQLINLSAIESNTSKWNRYFDLPNGIVTRNANVTIGRTRIDGCQLVESMQAPTGNAIWARGTTTQTLTVQGEYSLPVLIHNVVNGIKATNIHVLAKNISGANYQKAIYTTNVNPLVQIDVENCNFDNISRQGLHHRGFGKLNYYHNTLDIDGEVVSQGGGSILLGEGILATPVLNNVLKADIRDNTIDVNTGHAGITVFNCMADIHENTIDLDYDDPAVINGIGLHNPFLSTVSCNLITGTDYATQTHTNGIYLAGGSNLSVTCNDVTETGAGIRFFGMNDATLVRANTIDEHLFGLAYGYPGAGDGTFTSPQSYKGNYWTVLNATDNPADRYGAIHYASNFQPVNESNYTVNDSQGKYYMPKWTAAGTWFQSFNTSDNQTCTEATVPLCDDGPGVFRPETPDDLDSWIFQDSLGNAAWQATGTRRLLLRFAENANLVNDSTFSAFATAVSTSDDADRHEVAESVRLVAQLDSALTVEVKNGRQDLNLMMGNILNGMDSLAWSTSETDSTYWSAYVDSLSALYRTDFAAWKVLADSARNIIFDRLEDALDDNDSLTPETTWGENEQAVIHIGLSWLTGNRDTLSTSEIADLEEIASQCPTDGGDAVWTARSLLLGVGNYAWDDAEACQEAQQQYSDKGVPVTTDCTLVPNPATESITIWCTLPAGSSLVVSDLFGRQLVSQSFTGNGQRITTSHLNSGSYIIRISHSDHPVALQRFQITR
ncbi:MAG: T9SS type A sorting domain-containing protein [Lewinellaceae bacterium]|nr:T9SS type A sorting domain-containing protein [Saprospiraceae bacterium]MCB9312046.1 T9SS type A sorting domain-containing protein [Lewinellaceae bacterium]HRW74278.1 T9SS type A sorting domain-containing protein [Saprospiraceae bacterium]